MGEEERMAAAIDGAAARRTSGKPSRRRREAKRCSKRAGGSVRPEVGDGAVRLKEEEGLDERVPLSEREERRMRDGPTGPRRENELGW